MCRSLSQANNCWTGSLNRSGHSMSVMGWWVCRFTGLYSVLSDSGRSHWQLSWARGRRWQNRPDQCRVESTDASRRRESWKAFKLVICKSKSIGRAKGSLRRECETNTRFVAQSVEGRAGHESDQFTPVCRAPLDNARPNSTYRAGAPGRISPTTSVFESSWLEPIVESHWNWVDTTVDDRAQKPG